MSKPAVQLIYTASLLHIIILLSCISLQSSFRFASYIPLVQRIATLSVSNKDCKTSILRRLLLQKATSSPSLPTPEGIKQGSVTLVGAGPGDPELLTLQAYKLLKNASLVIADRLISPEILDLIDCEYRVARKAPGCADKAQEEINKWVIDGVKEGKNVVRLKIGDPFLFGRGGEEILEVLFYPILTVLFRLLI